MEINLTKNNLDRLEYLQLLGIMFHEKLVGEDLVRECADILCEPDEKVKFLEVLDLEP